MKIWNGTLLKCSYSALEAPLDRPLCQGHLSDIVIKAQNSIKPVLQLIINSSLDLSTLFPMSGIGEKNGRVSYLNYCDLEIFILKVSWHLTVKLFLFNFSILSRQRASLFSRLSPLIHQFGPFHSFAPYLFCLQMFDSSKISRVAIALLLLLKKNGLFMVREMNPFIAMSFKCVQNICLLLSGNSAQLWLQFQPC